MSTLNKSTIVAAATLIWGLCASAEQIPAGSYTNTFSGTAALYDPTGEHTQSVGGLLLSFTLNMDEKGKLTGDGTAFFTNGTTARTADISCIGNMKTTKGATRADFKMKLNGSASLGLIKESLDADLANLQMAGTASGTVASVDGGKRSTQKIAATPVSLNLPIGADGTWTLEMNIAPVGTKYTGSGSAAICGCKTYPITVSGAYNSRIDTSKLILNGQRAAHLVLTANFQNGAIQVQSLKGTMLGQKPHVP